MKPFFILLLLLVSISLIAPGQSTTIKGKVLLPTSKPANAVSVQIKETGKKILTNSGGAFSIIVSKLPVTLLFTYVGHNNAEYKVTEKNKTTPVIITLRVTTSTLDEVVVTGHSTSLKKAYFAGTSIRSGGRLPGSAAGIAAKSVTRYEPRKDMATPSTAPAEITKFKRPEREIKEVERRVLLPKIKQPLTKMLTAGELSDFKKWKLWSDYTEQDFKQWSKHWGIAPKTRYCVQIQNKDHKAMPGQKVYLINNKTNDTVWQAFTDNTGKAELWATLYEGDEKGNYRITCDKEVINAPAEFENGINRIVLKKTCNVSNIVDIAFVVDATGSMADEIRYLQEELQDVIAKTADKYKNVSLNSGAVFYRDRGDEYVTRHINFQANTSHLIDFIKKQSAGGGGDFPEAVDDALTTALDSLQWHDNARAKILFIVLDAPPHDAAKDRMNNLVKKAAAKGIRIVPIVCSGINKSTEYLMRSIALATNGSYVFLTDDSGIGNPHIKPTTDEFKVELLNNLLPRLIGDMIFVAACNEKQIETEPVATMVDSIVVLVYPNPTRGNITIQSAELFKHVFITDFTGKVLMNVLPATKGQNIQAYLGNYPSGTYLVKYYAEGKGWGSKQVVLVH